jgi:hypothetical protein
MGPFGKAALREVDGVKKRPKDRGFCGSISGQGETVRNHPNSRPATNGPQAHPVKTIVTRYQPLPTNGILVAITVMNCTLASSGRLSM